MNCPYEHDLLGALGRGFVGAELDAHVASCDSCSELRVVAGALLDDRAEAMIHAPIPTAGAMWLRVRMRQRQEAETRASRALLVGQVSTLLIAIAVVFVLLGGDVAFAIRQAILAIRFSTPVLVAIVACTLAAPIAGWVAAGRK